MSFRIKCPYCFSEFNDNEVHFRVPIVKEPDTSVLPNGCNSIEELNDIPDISDKEKAEIEIRYWRENFYAPRRDEKYELFWSAYDGTTEPILHNQVYPPYRKRVIVPSRDKRFLKSYDKDEFDSLDSYFIRYKVNNNSDETFVSEIKLFDDTLCSERVCPMCHNPLPNEYGAYPVKFISVVGNTHSGKTVFLSQFYKYFSELISKVGYEVPKFSPMLNYYVVNNKIGVKEKLPIATPPMSLQQPVIIDICNEKQRYTLVFYEIDSEVLNVENYSVAEINKYIEFVKNSDAIMMLMDPMQFSKLWGVLPLEEKVLVSPNKTLDALSMLLGERLKPIPFAACISKCDEIYDIMNDNYVRILKSDYQGIPREDCTATMKNTFNAVDYNSYEEYLAAYVYMNNSALDGLLATNFDDYSYFALSALGCSVDKETASPIGPISPKRIMDPFYWIMYKLDLTDASDGVYNPNGLTCLNPDCQKRTTNKLKEPYCFEEKSFFKKVTHTFTYYCSSCHSYFNPETGDYRTDE